MVWKTGQLLKNGQYVIDGVLGEGGFGVTYLARNTKGDRVVIKTLNDAMQGQANFVQLQEDFVNEALRLAKCSHPHVVEVYEVFQERRQPSQNTNEALWCMVMEYVEGENLWQRVSKGGALPEAEALHYIRQIGKALSVVHERNLLHRDVKPQNIILRKGDSLAVLIDFGIARNFVPDVTQYHTQAFTPGFAPIEQYAFQARRGAYTDVYALAATLYYLLTQAVPTPAAAIAANLSLVPPQQINPSISQAVNQAIIEGMAFEAKNRPQSVEEWLDLLPDLPVIEVPLNWQCVQTLTGHSGYIWSVAINPDGETLASGSGDETIKLWQLSSAREIRTLTGHFYPISSVAISPDGEFLASGSDDGMIKLWQLSSGREIRTLTGHSYPVFSVAISRDAQILASGSADNTIKLWQLSSGREICTLTGHSSYVYAVAISPDGQMLASGSLDHTIKLWQLSSGTEILTLTGHTDVVGSVAISPDGQTLASASDDGTIKLWSLNSDRDIRTLTCDADKVGSIAISPDGQTLASGGSDNTIKLWQLSSDTEICTLTGHSSTVSSVAFSLDGQTLVSGSFDHTIKIWRRI